MYSPSVHCESTDFLYCSTKYEIGQPLSGHMCSLNITDVELGKTKEEDGGTPGGLPWVRACKGSLAGEVPILLVAVRYKWYVVPHDKPCNHFIGINLRNENLFNKSS